MVTVFESKPNKDVVQITTSTRIIWPTGNDWPTPSEFRQLEIILKSRFPGMAEGISMPGAFKPAFLFLYFAGRRPNPDPGRALSYWTQVCEDWLTKMGIPGKTNNDALLGAAMAHGCISFTNPPHSLLGITLGESSEPLPSSWRKVLECGRIPEPAKITAPKITMPGEINIIGGGRGVGRF